MKKNGLIWKKIDRRDSNRVMEFTVSDKVLIELGKIVVYQAMIEDQIGQHISKLLNIDDDRGDIVTAELSFKQLIGLLSSLLIEKLGEKDHLFQEFKEIKKKLYEFVNFRNIVSHSMWAASKSGADGKAARMKVTSKEKKGLKKQHEEIELNEIIKKLDEAALTMFYLDILIVAITGDASHIEIDSEKISDKMKELLDFALKYSENKDNA